MIIFWTFALLAIVFCILIVFSCIKVCASADRIWEQLTFESQSQEGGDSSVGCPVYDFNKS